MIRAAHAGDLDALWRVRYAVCENTLTPGRISDDELLRSIDSEGQGWVAEVDGQVAGFAIGLLDGNVWALFIDPAHQGRGIGSQLHERMLAWFATLPVRRLWLSTGVTTRARHFYEARGWVHAGPAGEDDVRLERPNGPPTP